MPPLNIYDRLPSILLLPSVRPESNINHLHPEYRYLHITILPIARAQLARDRPHSKVVIVVDILAPDHEPVRLLLQLSQRCTARVATPPPRTIVCREWAIVAFNLRRKLIPVLQAPSACVAPSIHRWPSSRGCILPRRTPLVVDLGQHRVTSLWLDDRRCLVIALLLHDDLACHGPSQVATFRLLPGPPAVARVPTSTPTSTSTTTSTTTTTTTTTVHPPSAITGAAASVAAASRGRRGRVRVQVETVSCGVRSQDRLVLHLFLFRV